MLLKEPTAVEIFDVNKPGERFAELIHQKGHNQSTLVHAMLPVPCTNQTISDFVTGKTQRMQAGKWRRIADVLGLTIEELNARVYGVPAVPLPVESINLVMKLNDEDGETITITIPATEQLKQRAAKRGVGVVDEWGRLLEYALIGKGKATGRASKDPIITALNAVRVLNPKQLEQLGAKLTRFAAEAIARGSRVMDDRPAEAAYPDSDEVNDRD